MNNPYGLTHLWEQGDSVTHIVVTILIIMSILSWYVMALKAGNCCACANKLPLRRMASGIPNACRTAWHYWAMTATAIRFLLWPKMARMPPLITRRARKICTVHLTSVNG